MMNVVSRIGLGVGLAVGLLVGNAAGGDVRYVDDDAPAEGDGLSWDTAYRFLQDALAKDSDGAIEVRVAQGLYLPDRDSANPDGTGDRFATFDVRDSVALLGGYAGLGAPDPDERDPETYVSVLSGDLLGDDDEATGDNSENSHHVVSVSDVTDAALIEGLLITAGHANGAGGPNLDGAGIKCLDSDVVIRHCRFVRNVAKSEFYPNFGSKGGGIYAEGGTSLIEHCTFIENTGGAGGGGGIMCNIGDCVIRHCTFTGNYVGTNSGGAGLKTSNCNALVEYCDFRENLAESGGAPGASVGGSFTNDLSLHVRHCHFENNVSSKGTGALSFAGKRGLLEHCVFIGNSSEGIAGALRLVGSQRIMARDLYIQGNSCGEYGGGVYVNGAVLLERCVIVENIAGERGGGVFVSGDDVEARLSNLVIARNQAPEGGGLWFYSEGIGHRPVLASNLTIVDNIATTVGGGVAGEGIIANSIIRDNRPEQTGDDPELFVVFCNTSDPEPGFGNFDADPMFVDPERDDYRIVAASPCCDRGWNLGAIRDQLDLDEDSDVLEFHPTDARGLPRFVDAAAPNLGCGVGPIVDVGAYEVQDGDAATMDPADLDGDGAVGVTDLLILLSQFSQLNPCAVDVNGDLLSDLDDLTLIFERWTVN